MIRPDEFILTQCILRRFYKTAQEDTADVESETSPNQPELPPNPADESASPSRSRPSRRQHASRGFGLAPWLPGSVNLDQHGGVPPPMRFGPMGIPGLFGPGEKMPIMPGMTEMPQIDLPRPPTEVPHTMADIDQQRKMIAEQRGQFTKQLRQLHGLPYPQLVQIARRGRAQFIRAEKALDMERRKLQRLAANQPTTDNTESQNLDANR
jgi:hypothetical protein